MKASIDGVEVSAGSLIAMAGKEAYEFLTREFPGGCECQPCDSPAHADVEWTTDAMGTQSATLCEVHVRELWEKLNPLLQLNRATFRIDEPGKIKA